MKKTCILVDRIIVLALLVTLIVGSLTNNAKAELVRGDFAGTTIDIADDILELGTDAVFSGYFIYDTDAIVLWSNQTGTQMTTEGNLVELYFSLNGIHDYTYMVGPPKANVFTFISSNDLGTYAIDFDSIDFGSNFIGTFELQLLELFLSFDSTFVNDPMSPVLIPDADNFIGGNLLILLTYGELHCSISSLSLQSQSQPVPEPSTLLLITGGLTCLIGCRRSRNSSGRCQFKSYRMS